MSDEDRTAPEEAPAAGGPALSRRDAMKALGLTPLVGALEWSQVEVERAARFVRGEPVAGEEAAEAQAPAPRFFTAHDWRTVRVLVDYIIPRDARSGSATDARVPEYMDFLLAHRDASESSRIAMRGGLAWLDAECRRRFTRTFVACTDAQRRQLLDDVAWPAKAPPSLSQGVAFFNRFRDMTASGFFSSAIGWKDLQYMGHTFVPEWNGCPPAALQKLGVSYDVMATKMGGTE